MTEQEMEKIAEMVAVKLKGDENKMEVKKIIEALQYKKEFDDFFSKGRLNFLKKQENLIKSEIQNGLELIGLEFNYEDFSVKIKCGKIDEIFSVEDDYSTIQGFKPKEYTFEKVPLSNYYHNIQNFRECENLINFHFKYKTQNLNSLKTLIETLLTEELETKYRY